MSQAGEADDRHSTNSCYVDRKTCEKKSSGTVLIRGGGDSVQRSSADERLSVTMTVEADGEQDEFLAKIIQMELEKFSGGREKERKRKASKKTEMVKSNSFSECSQADFVRDSGRLAEFTGVEPNPLSDRVILRKRPQFRCRNGCDKQSHNHGAHHHCPYQQQHEESDELRRRPTTDEDMSKRQRLELLSDIYEQVKMITRVAVDGDTRPNPKPSSDKLAFIPSDGSVDVVTSCNPSMPVRNGVRQSGKRRRRSCRRSFPNDDPILPPPPLFEGTSSDDDCGSRSRPPPYHRFQRRSSGIEWAKLTKAAKRGDGPSEPLQASTKRGTELTSLKCRTDSAAECKPASKTLASEPDVTQSDNADDNVTSPTCVSDENVKPQIAEMDIYTLNAAGIPMTYCPSKETFLIPSVHVHNDQQKRAIHRATSSNMEEPNSFTGRDVKALRSSPHSTTRQTERKDENLPEAPWALQSKVSMNKMTERGSTLPNDSALDEDLELNSLLLSLQILSRTCDDISRSGKSNVGLAKDHNSRSNINGKSSSSDCLCNSNDTQNKEGLVTSSYNSSCKEQPDSCGRGGLNNNNSAHGVCQNSSCFRLLCHHPGSVSRAGHVADTVSESGSCHQDVREASTAPCSDNASSHHQPNTPEGAYSSGSCRFLPSPEGHDLCPWSRDVVAARISPHLDFTPKKEFKNSKVHGNQREYRYDRNGVDSVRISKAIGRCCGQEEVTYETGEEGSLKLLQADILTVLTSSLCDDLKIDALAGKDGVGVSDDVAADTNSLKWDDQVTKPRMGIKHNRSLLEGKEIVTTNPCFTSKGQSSTVPLGNSELGASMKLCNEEKPREKKKQGKLKHSYQRSKSLHREQSQEKPEDETWDSSNLNGSLRELAHLNIDVCQQLVDGKRVFTVKDASPELQVVVNSLTPVLSRRSRSRRSGHYDLANEALSSSVTSESESSKVCHASPRSNREDSTYTSANVSADDRDELSHKKFTVSSSIKASYHSIKPMADSHMHVSPILPMGKTQNHSTLMNLFDRISSRNACVRDDIGVERDVLAIELEESKNSLFISPKLSRTWHGASDFTKYRTGPKMGVGLMLSGKDGHSSAGNSPSSMHNSADKDRSSSGSPQHAQTLPIISRTLLDAMHKRYCAHQYSNNYQTLQPFTMLKIDPASSSGNQPITALRVEPCSVRDHEVHVAPPSPQFIARLRQLNSEFKANRFADAQFSPAPRSQLFSQQMPEQLPAPQHIIRPHSPPQRASPEKPPLRQTGPQLAHLSHHHTAGPHSAHANTTQGEGRQAMEVTSTVGSGITEASSSGHSLDKRLQHSYRPADGSAGRPSSVAMKPSCSSPDYDNLVPPSRPEAEGRAGPDGESSAAVVVVGAAINTDAVNGPANGETTGHAACAVSGGGAGMGELAGGAAGGRVEYKERVEVVGVSRCLVDGDEGCVLTPCSTDSLFEEMGNKLTTSRVRAGDPTHGLGAAAPGSGAPIDTKHKHSKRQKTDRAVTWSKSSEAVTWSNSSVATEPRQNGGLVVTSPGRAEGNWSKRENCVKATGAVSQPPTQNGGDFDAPGNNGCRIERDPLGVATYVDAKTLPDVATGASETSLVVTNHFNVCQECKSSGYKGEKRRTLKEQTFQMSTATAAATLNSHSRLEANMSGQALTPAISTTPHRPDAGPLSSAENNGPTSATGTAAPVSFFSEANRGAGASLATTSSLSSPEVISSPATNEGVLIGRETDQAFYGDYSEPSAADVVLRNPPPIRDNVTNVSSGTGIMPGQNANGLEERNSSIDPRYASIQLFSNGSKTTQVATQVEQNEQEEAIYAIPIPKSHRKPKDNLSQNQALDETFDNFENDSFGNRVEVTCQMKKSTTTGMISNIGHSQVSYRDTFRNDYFSLGRRPKRPRIPTLVDSKGIAVSLDVLLKIRRQNSVEDNRSSTVSVEAPSIEDILKSCHDFDPEAPSGYRRRTSSDGVSRNVRRMLGPAGGDSGPPNEQHGNLDVRRNVSGIENSAHSSHTTQINSETSYAVTVRDGHTPFAVSPRQSDHGRATDPCDSQAGGKCSSTDISHVNFQNEELKDNLCYSPMSPNSKSPGLDIVIIVNSEKVLEKERFSETDKSIQVENPDKTSRKGNEAAQIEAVTASAITSCAARTFVSSSAPTGRSSSSSSSTSAPDHRGQLLSSSSDGTDTSSLRSPMSVSSEDSGQCATNLLTVDTCSGVSSGDTLPGHKSPNALAKLEAIESLKWLRAAGFPQYAQMFEDGQFPVELSTVERDHDFLDADSLKSLFRRLETLNKYAGMKIHSQHKKKGTSEEDDEEEDLCALSERWEYQKSARRWSRKEPQTPHESDRKPLDNRVGSHDSLLADQDSGSQTGDSPLMDSKLPHQQDPAILPPSAHSHGGEQAAISAHLGPPRKDVAAQMMVAPSFSPPLRRSASEKVKPTRTLWKGMKSKKRSGASRGIVEISHPVVADKENMQAKLVKFNCRDISPTSDSAKAHHRPVNSGAVSPTSPQSAPPAATHTSSFESPFGSRKAFASQSLRVQPTYADHTDSGRAAKDSNLHGFYTAHSKLLQSLESAQQKETGVVKQNKSDNNLKEIFILPEGHQPGRFPTILQNGYIETKSPTPAAADTETLSDIPLHTDGAAALTFPPVTYVPGQRFSFYDNWLPAEHNRTDQGSSQHDALHVPPGSSPLTTGQESNTAVSFDAHKLDSIRESRSSSLLSTSGSQSDSDSRKLSDSHQDHGWYASTSTRAKSDLRTPSRESSAEPSIHGRSTQSPSVQSGDLTETSSMHSSLITSSTEASKGARESASSDLKLDYQEFDLILQQLFDKIQDLNNYVTKEDKGNTTAQTPLQQPKQPAQRSLSVDMSRSQPTTLELDSPVSPTSDLVMSPSSPVSTGGLDGTESVGENSTSGSSAGESSHSGSDQEVGLTDLSHDDSLDQITHVSMERRDSGVGHSLTRASGDRRRKKLRWNSFQKCHRPDVTCRAMQINSLTVSQLVRLQKLSLLKLTSIMEKYMPANKSGWNWMMAKLMKKKPPDFSDKNVFGVPFTVTAQRTGQPLPQCVLYAMRYLRRTSQNAVGIFRKSGVKSKIQQLRDHLEAHPETSDFEDANAYNVADMLKTYFRDLPECLLTNKMSETFRSIYTYVPQAQRLEALQAAILLLPDENREVLQSILLFLSDISAHEADHQMNASNLAVCFTPTVFQLGTRYTGSPKRNRKNSPGIPDPREILEQKAAHECLLMMISECKKLFTIPSNIFRQLQGTSLAHLEPASLQDIGNSPAEVKAFGQERIQMVLKEAHDKNRGWIPSMSINDVEVFHRKPMDDCPLKEWKLVVDIEAPPIEVLRRIMHERHTWDEDLLSWSVLERLDPHSDIFQYVLSSMAPHPSRHYCVLRYWRSDLTKGACALVTMSVEHSENMDIQGVWAIDLGSFILMEPCGSGRSRMTYITRVDTRGRSPEWYSKIFGHICANFLERLQESFKQESGGPETKV